MWVDFSPSSPNPPGPGPAILRHQHHRMAWLRWLLFLGRPELSHTWSPTLISWACSGPLWTPVAHEVSWGDITWSTLDVNPLPSPRAPPILPIPRAKSLGSSKGDVYLGLLPVAKLHQDPQWNAGTHPATPLCSMKTARKTALPEGVFLCSTGFRSTHGAWLGPQTMQPSLAHPPSLLCTPPSINSQSPSCDPLFPSQRLLAHQASDVIRGPKGTLRW